MSITILQGDVREVLPSLPSDHFDCCVTSPPYWGLRDYGVSGQIGLELTLAEYLETMVGVCREIRRVLKPEGTFWLNIGDSYAANRGGTVPPAETLAGGVGGWTDEGERVNRGRRDGYNPSRDPKGHGLKHKDLCMVPNRLAILLQEDGWYVRSEIIWHKPNPMPESVRDRPTSAHEKVWLLTKSERYFYDAESVKEPAIYEGLTGQDESGFKNPANFSGKHAATPSVRNQRPSKDKQRGHSRRHAGFNDRWDAMDRSQQCSGFRNVRNVWSIATRPFAGAHFATMAPELAERCVSAGSPAGGSVLDPFGGAGTTGLIADRLGRRATLIELNRDYIGIAKSRIEADSPLFARVAAQ